jgi:hypothetical protein
MCQNNKKISFTPMVKRVEILFFVIVDGLNVTATQISSFTGGGRTRVHIHALF